MVDEVLKRFQFYPDIRLDNKSYVRFANHTFAIFRSVLIELQHNVQFIGFGDCDIRHNNN